MTSDDKSIAAQPLEPQEIPEELKPLAKEIGEEKVRRIIAVYSETYSGPIPHPRIFGQYGQVLATAPERIMTMAEKEQDFQIHVGTTMLAGDERRADRGLTFGFVLFIALIIGAVVLLVLGKDTAGYILLGGAGLNAVTNFIRVGREKPEPPESKKGNGKSS